jgi:hypothetical protein
LTPGRASPISRKSKDSLDMHKRFAVPSAAALVAAGLAVAGCGSGLDTKDLQGKLADSIAGQLNVKASSLTVKCPKDESADKGTTFTCTVTDGKDTRDIAITVTDDKGHVDWKLK